VILALLIDLDGVIRIWDPDILANAEREARLPAGAIPRTAFHPDLLVPAITGIVSDETWRHQVTEKLHEQFPEADGTMAVQLWSKPSGKVHADVLDLVRLCRRSAAVALISNATSRLNADLTALGIQDEFDHIINTSEIGFAKPDQRAFDAALTTAGVSPAEALFVDDSLTNVEAARTMGMRGHHFVSVDTLREEFVEAGLLK